jgi:hypothetical protein
MVFDFLQPVGNDLIAEAGRLSSQHLGQKIIFHTQYDFPDLSQVKLAIFGVLENRGLRSAISDVDLSNFRRTFYGLYPGNWNVGIADLGDIEAGNSLEDTTYAVREVAAALMKQNILPIIIGGSQDLTYALYRAYDGLDQMVNLVSIDSRFDFGKESKDLIQDSYVTRIIVDRPNNLFNYCNIGYQTYFNSQEEIDLIEKLYFDAYRLGEVSANLAIAEPVFRDADLVSLDLTSVKSSDSGNPITFIPNGFTGKEICALSRYAGISDKTTSFGIFNHHGSTQEAELISQIVWYFIEGYHYRSCEYPFGSRENYLKYIIPTDDHELIFYKSDKTDRWWIEIPDTVFGNNKLKKNTLLPCSYDEYLSACNQELPERWWKALRKNAI